MTRKFICLCMVLTVLFTASCKKEESQNSVAPPQPEHIPNYMPLEIGNYWVYETYKVENHQETLLDKVDSLRVIKDTLVRNEKFFIIPYIRKLLSISRKD